MRAHYVPSTSVRSLLDPSGAVWKPARSERMKLEGTPLALQPTGAIRNAWKDKKIGAVSRVDVSALHDGNLLAIQLEWDDPTENREVGDNTDFPDGVAVAFPSVPNAPLITMGAKGYPVNAWYWRADADTEIRHVIGEGIGTSRTVSIEADSASASWKEGRWRVVITRALRVDTPEPVAQFSPGDAASFGVAIWDGASSERGGIKAFTGPQWIEFQLDTSKQS